MELKDLHKPGRKLDEYINEDGTLKITCISCAHRPPISKAKLGGYICGDDERHAKCNPRCNYDNKFQLDYLLWKPRVQCDFISEKDMEI